MTGALGRCVLPAAFVGIVGLLGVRAAQYSLKPEFDISLPYHHPVWFELDDVSYVHEVSDGRLRIEARHAQPGHERIGYFRLGPSTFVNLSSVRVVRLRGGESEWQVTAKAAQLTDESIELSNDVVLTDAGHTTRPARVRISLKSGRLRR